MIDKKTVTTILIIMVISMELTGQVVLPVISFEDDALTHNMHICSDNLYYYTVNGGIKEKGIINKFNLQGNWLNSFPLKLDTRSIMYNAARKKFYVNDYARNIYVLTDFEIGAYEIVFRELYENKQASLALDNDGKQLFYLNDGTVRIFDFRDGQLLATFNGIEHGKDPETGSCAIAAGTKYFYTWDAKTRLIYAYNMEGKLLKKISIARGDYGYSLSYANGLVFVSEDGDQDVGMWYGYDLDAVAEATIIFPKQTFSDNVKGNPYHICFDFENKIYYTTHSAGSNEGIITEFSLKGQQKKSYIIDKDIRSIMFNPLNKQLYINTASKNFYKITKLKKGKMELIAGNIFKNKDCTPSLSANGINIYSVSGHKIVRRDFYMPKNKRVFNDIKTGEDMEGGAYACAVGEKFIYTWNAQSRLVFLYDFKGEYLRSIQLSNGSIGASLSFANKKLFVAGINDTGGITWYGYETE